MSIRSILILLGLAAVWGCNNDVAPLHYTSQAFRLRIEGKTTSPDGARVSPEFWTEAKAVPTLGRPFLREEYVSPNPAVVLLSHDLWEESFHSDPRIIGRQVELDGVLTTVVGILPAGFHFPGNSKLWVPREAGGK